VWTVLLVALNPAQDVLGDSITELGFSVCFYYGFTGLACAWYYRRDLFTSWRHFALVGLLPLAGCVLMFAVFAKAFHDYSQTGAGYSTPLWGIQIPIVIGIGSLLLGVPLIAICAAKYRAFFRRRTEIAPDGLLDNPVEHAVSHF
ncbi:MAG TPA: hypothetical protein VEG24_02555, partial [Gaiellaceae bacterium]|nr:hypothetical protein [Gaiellaceae bacterium]